MRAMLLIVCGVALLLPGQAIAAAEKTARELGLKGDAATDDTDALAAALKAGASEVYFEDGTYYLGTVRIPADTRLRFSPRAKVRVNTARIEDIKTFIPSKRPDKPLFLVAGNNVTIDGLQIDFTLAADANALIPPDSVRSFIYAAQIKNLNVTRCIIEKPERREMIPLADRKRGGRFKGDAGHTLLFVEDCADVTLSNSRASSIDQMVNALMCRNVSVHGNRMVTGNTITTFSVGGEFLRHFDNWSSDVRYQVVWRGGSPDPSRKAPEVPLGSSTIVKRGSRPDDSDYNRHTAGVFDVIVQNNYAEYGNTLCWGNKSRQVIIANNIARYISDYAFGTEGAENVLMTGNISINSTAGSFVSMYWGEKIQIVGNTAIVRSDNWNPELSWWPTEKQYHGGFVRLHHGPQTNEDRAAGSKYGAGQVTITGNLFVNELPGIPKGIGIQAGRDVTISGNKFLNGNISKTGSGGLVVSDNEFVWNFATEFPSVQARNSSGNVTIANNVMRREPKADLAATDAAVKDLGPGLAFTEEDKDEQAIPSAAGAISVDWKNPLRLVASGNTIDGWTKSMTLACDAKTPGAILLTGNSMNGTIETAGNWMKFLRDNVQLQTLEPIEKTMEMIRAKTK